MKDEIDYKEKVFSHDELLTVEISIERILRQTLSIAQSIIHCSRRYKKTTVTSLFLEIHFISAWEWEKSVIVIL